MSITDGVERKGFAEIIDDHRRVEGWIPEGGAGVHFDFWNGAVRSSIRLSDEAFQAAVRIYAALQKQEIEAHTAQGEHPAERVEETENGETSKQKR